MTHSLSDQQITMLRLAKRQLTMPGRGGEEGQQRNDLALLVMLKLVDLHGRGFRLTAAGQECLRRIDEAPEFGPGDSGH